MTDSQDAAHFLVHILHPALKRYRLDVGLVDVDICAFQIAQHTVDGKMDHGWLKGWVDRYCGYIRRRLDEGKTTGIFDEFVDEIAGRGYLSEQG